MKTLRTLQHVLGNRLKEDESLARFTTLKIGGPADLFYEAHTTDELHNAMVTAKNHHIPITVLGGGSNILVGDKGIRGLVIRNMTNAISIRGLKGNIKSGTNKKTVFVQADSGVSMNKLVRFTIDEGLAGLEMQLGLPGSVGGALYMNSKWTNPVGYVGDVVYQATILTKKGEIATVPASYFRFGYDQSIIQDSGDVVLRVVFALIQKSKDELWERANASIAYRRQSQPQGILSAGCTFRNITHAEALSVPTPNHTTSAGYLLDHAGLKGESVGDAQFSPIHANFIINRGRASASDVVTLIERAREKVFSQFGVKLKEEIVRIGEF